MPRKNGKITKLLGGAFALERPVVVYESPYRIIKFLELVKTEFGPQIKVALARELTKTFEENTKFNLDFSSGERNQDQNNQQKQEERRNQDEHIDTQTILKLQEENKEIDDKFDYL